MKKMLFFLGVALLPILGSAESPLKIPAMAALTGDAASMGNSEREGFTLAIEEWNAHGGLEGRRLELQLEDTMSTTSGTISAFKKLHALEGHKVLLGPTWGDTFQGIVPVAVTAKALLVTPSAEGRAIDQKVNRGPTMVTTYPSTEKEVQELVDFALRRGAKRVGILSEEEPFALFVREVFLRRAELQGLSVVVDQSVLGTTTDFRSLLSSAKRQRVDSLFFILYTDRSFSAALKQKNELFPEAALYGTHDLIGYAERSEFLPYLEGAVLSTFDIRDESFRKRFEQRFGHPPLLTSSYAYDAANLLLRALSLGKKSVEEVRSYLLETEHETVSYGRVRFLPEGRFTEAQIGIAQIQDGKVVPVKE